jgi:SNF2 family DNA or RNA helicase
MIAQRTAGGIGVNLVGASYSIIFSRDFSLNAELQSEARNHRGGSQIHDKIIKIDLITENSIEKEVVKALNNKEEIASKIIDVIRNKKEEI